MNNAQKNKQTKKPSVLLEERINIHRMSHSVRIRRSQLLIMRMQIHRKQLIILQCMKKVHRRIFHLPKRFHTAAVAAASHTQHGALGRIVAPRKIALSKLFRNALRVVHLGWNEGWMPKRLSIGLRLGRHWRMPKHISRSMQRRSLVDRAI